MPYRFPSPGSYNDSARRNGLVLSPETHLERFYREAALFRATHPEVVPIERLGRSETIIRQQFIAASESGEPILEAPSFDVPVTPIQAFSSAS